MPRATKTANATTTATTTVKKSVKKATKKVVKAAAPTATQQPAKPSKKLAAPATAKPAAKAAPQSPPKTTAAHASSAKQSAVNKAKAIAPDVPARLGSTPATKFRGNPDLFGTLVHDHDRHRALLAMVAATRGKSPEREALFTELTLELKSHAAAEEQALWSSVMRNPATTEDARHAVGEHKEIDKMLADLAARDMASSGWLKRFAALHDAYLHHIAEEEQEQFVAAQKHLSAGDLRHMQQVFKQRKKVEKANTTVEKKIRLHY